MSMIRGILIDPFAETCTVVVMPYEVHRLLDNTKELMQCHLIDVVRLGGETIMYIDDEGRCIDRGFQRWFKLGENAYAGRAIVFAEDDEGNTLSANRSIADIEKHLTFLPEDYHEEPYMEFRAF